MPVRAVTMLIVNADDFGMSESINAGIVDAHRGGIVTSTTWLAEGDAAEAAVERAATSPQLDVGLHLALSDVRPSGDPEPFRDALGEDGRWPSGFAPLLRWMRGQRDARAVVHAEWRAQLDRFRRAWGRLPTHLDSHQHLALAPGLQLVLVELARAVGIPALRVPQEVRGPRDWPGPGAWRRPHETLVLSALARALRRRARRAGLAAPSSFAGFRQSGRLDEATLLGLLPRLGGRGGTVELMTHPGAHDTGRYRRAAERDALRSDRVRAALDRHELALSRFSDLT